MKLHEKIKNRRQALNLTQKEVADYLWISVQAVSKWEKGTNYPDVAILPMLARLLKIDLNELFDFEESLSEQEIQHFTYDLINMMQDASDFEKVFAAATTKVREFPSSEELALHVATVLEQLLDLFTVVKEEKVATFIDLLYKRLLNSDNEEMRQKTILTRVPQLLQQEKFEEAEKLIDTLPEPVDKSVWQGEVYLKQKRFAEAQTVFEKKLMALVYELNHSIWGLAEAAYGQEEHEVGHYYQQLLHDVMPHLGISEVELLNVDLNIAIAQEDANKAIALLLHLWGLDDGWTENAHPIRQMIEKHGVLGSGEHLETAAVLNLIDQIKHDPNLEMIRLHKDYPKLLKKMEEAK